MVSARKRLERMLLGVDENLPGHVIIANSETNNLCWHYAHGELMEGPEAARIPPESEKWIRASVILMDARRARVSGP